MDFLARKLRDLRVYFIREEKLEKKREITRFEAYLELGYRVLSWEDASLTLTVFLVLNFVFWLVVQLQLKFFGVVFLLTLVGFVADAVFENNQYLGGESRHVDFFDEVKEDLNDVVLSLKALRKDNPAWFCLGMSVVFLFMSFIARNVSGNILFYLMLLGIFFIPLGLSKMPPEYLASVRHFVKSLGSEKGVLAEDELIPFISDKDFNQRDPDLDSLLTDKTADSVNNSLISGLHSMPSYLDAEDKESLEEDDLLPGTSHAISYTPGEISSDSDSENKGIRFESGHFNGDSSSEEEQYAKNLTFEESREVTDDSHLSEIAAVSGNLMCLIDAIRNAVITQPTQRKDSSSDSDFEMINSEEVDEH